MQDKYGCPEFRAHFILVVTTPGCLVARGRLRTGSPQQKLRGMEYKQAGPMEGWSEVAARGLSSSTTITPPGLRVLTQKYIIISGYGGGSRTPAAGGLARYAPGLFLSGVPLFQEFADRSLTAARLW
ncbi:unnamed protein product [Lota lota]